jgi:hypothetical protein
VIRICMTHDVNSGGKAQRSGRRALELSLIQDRQLEGSKLFQSLHTCEQECGNYPTLWSDMAEQKCLHSVGTRHKTEPCSSRIGLSF